MTQVKTPIVFSVASYNVRQYVGMDGRCHPRRIARVIQELRTDIIGLQEVDYRSDGKRDAYQLDYLADVAGFRAIAGPIP